MEKLKNNIIQKSPVIEHSQTTNSSSSSSMNKKIQNIYRFALNTRGGQEYDFMLAEQIQNFVIRTAIFLKKNEKNTKVKYLFRLARIGLQFILARCKIHYQYIITDEISKEIAFIAICSGGAAGFVLSWFAVGAVLIAPPTLLSAFFLRSMYQQYLHNGQYREILNFSKKLIKDEEFREETISMFIEAKKRIENSNRITLKHLNCNKNTAIKEAVERLGVFQNTPSIDGLLHINTLDFESEEILEHLGLIQKPQGQTPSLEDLNEFLKSNPRTTKNIITDTISHEDELDVS